MPRRKCFYELLGVPRNVDGADLKKVYRQLALKYHPDKNPEDPEAAKRSFQEIQNAYEVLSDTQERAWYDAHREAILQGGVGTGNEVDVGGIDLFPYFSTSCYNGFGDDDEGFYTVYRQVFENLAMEDKEFAPVNADQYPTFGHISSEETEWHKFYAFFMAYVTPRTYAWLDQYDTRRAENRKTYRLMEKENKKVRDAAKKERNELVRSLAKFIRKRDKRVLNFNRRLEEKTAENAKKTQELRQRHLDERARLLAEATAASSSCFELSGMEKELQAIENEYGGSDIEAEAEANYCMVCNKQFRNEKAYANHLNQKRHRENVTELKKLLAEGCPIEDHGIDVFQLEQNLKHDDGNYTKEDEKTSPRHNANKSIQETPEESSVGKTESKKTKKSLKETPKNAQTEHSQEAVTGIFTNKERMKKSAKVSNPRITVVKESLTVPGPGMDTTQTDLTVGANKKKKKSRRKSKGDLGNGNSCGDEYGREKNKCFVCDTVYDSKNKLFNHLKKTGHAIFTGK